MDYVRFSLSLDRSLLLVYDEMNISIYNFNTHTFNITSSPTTIPNLYHITLSHNNRFLAIIVDKTPSSSIPTTCSIYDLRTHTLLWRHEESRSSLDTEWHACFSLHDRFVIIHLDRGGFLVMDVLTGDQVYRGEETNHKRLGNIQNRHVLFFADSLNNKVHVYKYKMVKCSSVVEIAPYH